MALESEAARLKRLRKTYSGIVRPHRVEAAPPINWNETLCIVATPQWGKTRLMQALAEPLRANLVVADTAQRGEWDNFGLPITSDWRDIGRLPGLVWRPNIDHVLEWDGKRYSDEWSSGLGLILDVRAPAPEGGRRGGVTVILDEMMDSAPARLHPRLRRGVIQGQGRGLGLWGGTQSPYGVSQRLLSAASHRFLGRIGTAQERGIIEASWGALPPEQPPDHGFYYIGPRGQIFGPVVLDLADGELKTRPDSGNSEAGERDREDSATTTEPDLIEAARP